MLLPIVHGDIAESTTQAYVRLVRRLMRASGYWRADELTSRDACLDIHEDDLRVGAHFCVRNVGRWAAATRRLYRSAFLWLIRERQIHRYEDIDRESLQMIESMDCAGANRVEPRLKRVPERFEEWLEQQKHFVGPELGVKLFYLANRHVGLRPVEWLGSTFLCPYPKGKTASVLHVRSAKTTHGRGLGEWRELSLDAISHSGQMDMLRFWAYLQSWLEQRPPFGAVDFAACPASLRGRVGWWFYQYLREAWLPMRRFCLDHGILRPDEESLIFYSTRHQVVANAKKTLPKSEVARVFGHASLKTADSWYGYKRDGRHGLGVRPFMDAKMELEQKLRQEIAERLERQKRAAPNAAPEKPASETSSPMRPT